MQRILNAYLDGDYDDELDGWVSYDKGTIIYEDANTNELTKAKVILEFEDQSFHLIKFEDDGWIIQHPLSCRPNLFDCKYNVSMDSYDGIHRNGIYRCALNDYGELEILDV